MTNSLKLYVLTIIAVIWMTAAVRIASAQDTAAIAPVVAAVDHASFLIVPANCQVNADAINSVHTVMCDGQVECTARVLKLVCGGGK